MLIPSVLFLFCRKEIGMHKNTWPLKKGCRILCSQHFWVHKKVCPHPICTNPCPLINDRSLNTPHQRHYSSYLLISTFWGGVVKDREAPFSSPNYVLLKNVWGLMSLLVAFNLQKMWNANWIHGPNCHVSFIWMQSLSNVFLVRMIRNQFHSSSWFFPTVVEYRLNQFPCHRHVAVKTVNKQISHTL